MTPSPDFDAAYYAANYGNYALQNPPHKLQWYLSMVAPHLAGRTQPRVLDIGCAFASFLSQCPPDWQKFGIDMSHHGVKEAAKNLGQYSVSVASAEAIPLTGPFDLITSFDTLEHVPDLGHVQKEVHRLLQPNGLFLFVVPVYDGPTGPIISLLDKDPTHIHTTSRRFWLDWAGEAFEILDWRGMYRYLFGNKYIHWPTHKLRHYTPAIAVLCRISA